MAQVPMRMAQPSLVPPHQQRPPMMVSMTQPPPVSMTGMVSMAPMMAPAGGMAVMTQAMSHPDSGVGPDHHTLSGPYHHHHPHHPHHAPPGSHHPGPPPHHPSGPPQPGPPTGPPPHTGPPHSQYHPTHHQAQPQHHVPQQHPTHSTHHTTHHSTPHSGPPHSSPHSGSHTGSHSSSHTNPHSAPHTNPHSAPHTNPHSAPHTSSHSTSHSVPHTSSHSSSLHSGPYSGPHSHNSQSGPHMGLHSNSGGSSPHNGSHSGSHGGSHNSSHSGLHSDPHGGHHTGPSTHLQPTTGPPHMTHPTHSIMHHSTQHQMNGMGSGGPSSMNNSGQQQQHQPHHQQQHQSQPLQQQSPHQQHQPQHQQHHQQQHQQSQHQHQQSQHQEQHQQQPQHQQQYQQPQHQQQQPHQQPQHQPQYQQNQQQHHEQQPHQHQQQPQHQQQQSQHHQPQQHQPQHHQQQRSSLHSQVHQSPMTTTIQQQTQQSIQPGVQPQQPPPLQQQPPQPQEMVGMVSDSSDGGEGGSPSTNSSIPPMELPDTDNTDDSASSKEKTPMLLINELARYNKIQHQYCLTDEKGPAHKKTFTVTLRLGDNEEYTASGPSIKKAQHSAAGIALEKTQFKHPPPKTQRQNKQNGLAAKLTPTVELNALTMKRGEAAVYSFMETPRQPNPYFNVPPNIRPIYNQKYYGRPPLYPVFFVTLRVGSREFVGEGTTAQQAKHNAASKALKLMKTLPLPENTTTCTQGDLSDLDPNANLKSPISLVHEIALKRSLTVGFEVVRESGPPHVRTFITVCVVGEYRTEGEGTGKKVSKKRAAELMLEELRRLPALPPTTLVRIKRKPTIKKKSRNLLKVGQEEQKAAPEYGQGINPISRLIQIQQAKKEKEPVYTLLAERGVPRRREFIMQVTVGSQNAQGSGPNKKLAKRAAAENMLQLLGFSHPQPQPGKPAIKTDGAKSDPDKTRKTDRLTNEEVTFLEDGVNDQRGGEVNGGGGGMGGGGRQLVPGLIMMPDGSALHGFQPTQPQSTGMESGNIQATATIAKELLNSGNSPTAEAMVKPTPTHTTPQGPPAANQMPQQPPPPPPQQPSMTAPPQLQQQQQQQQQHSHEPQQQIQQQPIQTQLHEQPQHTQLHEQPQHTQLHQQPQHTQLHQQPQQHQQQYHQQHQYQQQQQQQPLSQPPVQQEPPPPQQTVMNQSNNMSSAQAVRPKDQLMYLAQILGLHVQFTDFPKGNKSEYLSLVSLSTNPPHVSHGAGTTIDDSHDQACLTALRALAKMGLDTVTAAKQD